MTTLELLEQLQIRHQLRNDYQVAKYLGVSTGRIANYRSGRNAFDDLMACRIADELELDRGQVLAWIHAERAEASEQPEVAKAWQRLAKRAAIAGLVAIGVSATPAPSPTAAIATNPCVLCKTRSVRRLLDLALAALAVRFVSPTVPL